jgi:hypothetical protein
MDSGFYSEFYIPNQNPFPLPLRAFLSRSSRASLSDRCVPLLLVGIGIVGILGSETGVRGNFGAGRLGTFGKSRRGIDSFRGRYWSLYLLRRSRNSYRKLLVICTPSGVVYPPSTWYTEKAGGRSSKKYQASSGPF